MIHRRGGKSGETGDGPSRFLATVGVGLSSAGVTGMFLDKSEALAGGSILIGAVVCVISVLGPRLSGPQELSLTKAKLNIAADVVRGETELRSERLPDVSELP